MRFIHHKLCDLFGGNWGNHTNWFNNDFIFRHYNGKIYLYFLYEGSAVYGGWDGEFLNPDTLNNYIYYVRYITMDDFLDICVLG